MLLSAKMTSEFDKRVYQAVSMIPAGMVTTYKLLAIAINCRSFQAVGQALRRNPFAYVRGCIAAPRVPCHRVIKSDLSLGGFMGEVGGAFLLKKIALLQDEGVIFKDGRLLDSSKLFTFPDYHS
jgi:methylated-DNA-[protein]-cysteine S-methyltransferase